MKNTLLISFLLFAKIIFSETTFSSKNETSYFNFTTACTHLSANAVFTSIGGAGLIGTTILTGILVHSYNNQSSTTNKEFAQIGIIIPALLGFASSAVILTIGLPQLGVGIHKVKKYKKLISK